MLWVYIAIVALIIGVCLAAGTDLSVEGCTAICLIIVFAGAGLTFSISDNEADKVETNHEVYEIISLEEAGLVPPYGENDYAVYTENGIGFYYRAENGLIAFKEVSNVEFRESMEPRYEFIEYDHKEGAERHLKVKLFLPDKIIYLPADATIRPVYPVKEG